jgi:hypothetical protein
MNSLRTSLMLAFGVAVLTGCATTPAPTSYEGALDATPYQWSDLLKEAKAQKSYVMGHCDNGTTVVSVRQKKTTFRVVTAVPADGTQLHWVQSGIGEFYVVERGSTLVSFTDKDAFLSAMMKHAPMYATSWTSNRAADCKRTDRPTSNQ